MTISVERSRNDFLSGPALVRALGLRLPEVEKLNEGLRISQVAEGQNKDMLLRS